MFGCLMFLQSVQDIADRQEIAWLLLCVSLINAGVSDPHRFIASIVESISSDSVETSEYLIDQWMPINLMKMNELAVEALPDISLCQQVSTHVILLALTALR